MPVEDEDFVWDLSESPAELAETIQRVRFNADAINVFPEALLVKCWEDVEENGSTSVSIPVIVEVLRFRTMKHCDVEAALDLKKLFEVCFHDEHAVAKDIITAIYKLATIFLHKRQDERGVARSGPKADALQFIEEQFFGDFSDRLGHLHAGLLLTCYRSIVVNLEPTKFMAAIYAIREAYAYYIAGATPAARDSLSWARQFIDRLDPDRESDRNQAHGAGIALKAAATAANHAKEYADKLALLQVALRLLPLEGDERAGALLDLAIEYERREMFADAIETYKAVLEVSNVEDETPFEMARVGIAVHRAKFESNPAHVIADPHLDKAFDVDSSGWAEFMTKAMEREMKGPPLSDEEQVLGMDCGLRFVKSLLQKKQSEQAFGNLLLPLRVGMSVTDPEKYPAESLTEIIDLADSLERFGKSEDVSSYRRLRMIVVEDPRMEQFRLRKKLQETLVPARSLRDVLREIRRLPKPPN